MRLIYSPYLDAMKQLTLLFIAFISFLSASAQPDQPPYKQVPVIPAFTILLTDSTEFSKADIPKKPVVIIYFNPECGHCQLEAEELSKNMDKFKNVFFVMAAYQDMNLIKEFAEKYKLNQYKNIKIGRDTKYFLPVFYQVKSTPFSALYNKKGKFVKAFEREMTVEALQEALK